MSVLSGKEIEVRQAVGVFMILMAAATMESDWVWVPLALLGAGTLLALKKAPSRRQAKDGAHKKYNQIKYSIRRRI